MNDIAELRAAADRGTSAAKEAEGLRRELAFTKAGVDTDTPIGAMFAKAYDGDLDLATVKEAWGAVAPVSNAQPPVVVTPPPTDETEQRRLLTSGGAGDTPVETPLEDPVERGYEGMHARLKAGERRETAAGDVFGSLFKAAAEGDERAIWNGWTKEQLNQ